MQALSCLAWLYWNPPLEAFTVPVINRPIVWYGILFVSGFIIGYFLFVSILSRYFTKNNQLSQIDILKWPLFIHSLQNSSDSNSPLYRFVQSLEPKKRADLKKLESENLTKETKQIIINDFNQFMQSQGITRETIEKELPYIASTKRTAYLLADRLLWFIIIGTLVGARLGHVFFYDWSYFQNHLGEIFKVWKGGLASHGGTIGVLIGLYLYFLSIKEYLPHFAFLRLLDFVAIPSALTACFIRLGNFMNQEIVGTPSQLPWAVVFGNAADGSLPLPRHPVQLYEALAYFITFLILFTLWKRGKEQPQAGFFVGLFFILIFTARFILEFWKVHQDSIFDTSLQAGQLLSIPFILLGILFVYFSKRPTFSALKNK